MAVHFEAFEQTLHTLREEIRKETSDVYNRLHSIDEDLTFVASIHSAYPRLPLIRP
jgi:tRNA A64-2'-O-ribosylphosphate transferase